MRENVGLTHMSRNLPERVWVFLNFIGRDDFSLPTCDILHILSFLVSLEYSIRQTETSLPLLSHTTDFIPTT